LGSDAALLDREAGDVAGAEDVGKTVHLAVRVHRQEALDRLRQAVDPRPTQTRQRDDAVGRDRSLGNEPQLPVRKLDRARTGLNRDFPLLQQLSHPARAAAQRRALHGHRVAERAHQPGPGESPPRRSFCRPLTYDVGVDYLLARAQQGVAVWRKRDSDLASRAA
jgi:hypothetical protein